MHDTHVANYLNHVLWYSYMYTDTRLDQVSINFSGFILAAVRMSVLISKCRYKEHSIKYIYICRYGLKYKFIHGLLARMFDDPLPKKKIKVRTRADKKLQSDCSNPSAYALRRGLIIVYNFI